MLNPFFWPASVWEIARQMTLATQSEPRSGSSNHDLSHNFEEFEESHESCCQCDICEIVI